MKLVNANSVTGTGGSIQLVDQNGDAISDARTLDLSQNGVKVAEGTYDFGLTAGAASDGLYVNYGLQQVNLLGSGDEALVLTPADGATGAATDLAAKVIGVGDLAIRGWHRTAGRHFPTAVIATQVKRMCVPARW